MDRRLDARTRRMLGRVLAGRHRCEPVLAWPASTGRPVWLPWPWKGAMSYPPANLDEEPIFAVIYGHAPGRRLPRAVLVPVCSACCRTLRANAWQTSTCGPGPGPMGVCPLSSSDDVHRSPPPLFLSALRPRRRPSVPVTWLRTKALHDIAIATEARTLTSRC